MGQHAILITLMVGATKKEASNRLQEIYDKVVVPAMKIGVTITPHPVHYTFFNEFIEDVNGMKVSYKLTNTSKPPKGFSLTRLIRNAYLFKTKPDYIIYCDGSGRIPFEQCLTVLKELQKKEVSHVFSNRVPWRSGIPKHRKIVEEFESWIVCKQFKIKDTLDLQCGLWGFLYSEGSKMHIDCEGYEIELNVACEVFKHLKSGIIDVKTSTQGTTRSQFPDDDYSKTSQHFQKAYYLHKYFGISKKKLIKLAKQHNGSVPKNRKLPKEYLKMLETIEGTISKPDITQLN